MQTTVKVPCPIEGMEGVEVEVNMMASRAEVSKFIFSQGEERDGVIVAVHGWDDEQWSDDPFGEDAPMAFHVWVVKRAMAESIYQYGADPNSRTGSSRSTRRTGAARS